MTCSNRDCPDCHPEDGPPSEPAWAWPWSVALLILLAVWAAWFVTSGAVRP